MLFFFPFFIVAYSFNCIIEEPFQSCLRSGSWDLPFFLPLPSPFNLGEFLCNMLFFCWRLQRRERWVYIYTPLLLYNARAQVKGTKEVYLASRRCSLILVFSKQNSVVVELQMADKHLTWPHQSMKTRLAQRTFAIQFAFSSIWWSHSVLVEMLFSVDDAPLVIYSVEKSCSEAATWHRKCHWDRPSLPFSATLSCLVSSMQISRSLLFNSCRRDYSGVLASRACREAACLPLGDVNVLM